MFDPCLSISLRISAHLLANYSTATINHQKTGYSTTKHGDIHQTNMGLPLKMDGLPPVNGYLRKNAEKPLDCARQSQFHEPVA